MYWNREWKRSKKFLKEILNYLKVFYSILKHTLVNNEEDTPKLPQVKSQPEIETLKVLK